MSFQKLLIALDESDDSQTVLQQAIALTEISEGATLKLFHCLSYKTLTEATSSLFADVGPYPDLMARAYQDQQRQIAEQRERAEQLLKRYGETAAAAGVPYEAEYVVGEVGHAICRAAADWSADLIVMGRRGRSGLSEAFLGSASNYVLHHARCSVLVVQ